MAAYCSKVQHNLESTSAGVTRRKYALAADVDSDCTPWQAGRQTAYLRGSARAQGRRTCMDCRMSAVGSGRRSSSTASHKAAERSMLLLRF